MLAGETLPSGRSILLLTTLALGDIEPMLSRSLVAKLSAAAVKFHAGECGVAENIYRAFILEVEAQRGKGIGSYAADILITDAEYLIANCP